MVIMIVLAINNISGRTVWKTDWKKQFQYELFRMYCDGTTKVELYLLF